MHTATKSSRVSTPGGPRSPGDGGKDKKKYVQSILAQFHGEHGTPEQSCPCKCLVSYIHHSKLSSSHTQKSKKQQVKLNNKSVA